MKIRIDETMRMAVTKCIAKNLSFALYATPRSNSFTFVASVPDASDDFRNVWHSKNPDWHGFFINFFGNDEEYTAGVRDELDAVGAIALCDSLDEPYPEPWVSIQKRSTERIKYLSVVTGVINRLKDVKRGKTVMSRLEVTASDRDVLDVALDYFALYPDTFRYICFTQETGIWFGATPEVLALVRGNHIDTMALAGTMKTRSRSDWSDKNIDEHKYVVAYLMACLKEFGAEIVGDIKTGELRFGNIKHLYTPLSADLKSRDTDLREMLTRISPTPAVGGAPRDKALAEIFVNETHERLCYAGFVGAVNNDVLAAFVNLRCAMAAPREDGRQGYTYNVFSGGGITADSVAADEWDEAVSKVERLINVINDTVSNTKA